MGRQNAGPEPDLRPTERPTPSEVLERCQKLYASRNATSDMNHRNELYAGTILFRRFARTARTSAMKTGGKDQPIEQIPAADIEQRAGREGCEGDRAEDKKVVRGLDLGALLRPVAIGHQRGRADETEVPAEAEQRQRRPEMPDRDAGQADDGRDCDQDQPRRRSRVSLPKRPISRPVKKLGVEHGKDMPLDAQRRSADRQPAADHREGRGGHHEAHQAIGDEACNDGDDETRLARRSPATACRRPVSERRQESGARRRNDTTTIAIRARAA